MPCTLPTVALALYNHDPAAESPRLLAPWAPGGRRKYAGAPALVLGGSSAMNGMYHVRPSKVEIDAWSSLVNGTSKWNWDALFAGMKESETFTPPMADIQAIVGMEYNASSRGTNGPIHASYPGL